MGRFNGILSAKKGNYQVPNGAIQWNIKCQEGRLLYYFIKCQIGRFNGFKCQMGRLLLCAKWGDSLLYAKWGD
jgi:hypothetical protein